ncbi:MAG: c-type cytochrome [candidate division NC10 bacterium]|nr:c-type cytochrome [candidate division NC10 bacterium]
MVRRRSVQASFLAAAVALGVGLAGCAAPQEAAQTAGRPAAPELPAEAAGGPLAVSLTPAAIRTPSPELLALGRRVYEKQCVACHGADGRGEGEAAYLLYPKPRDFVAAKYALVSTWDRVPTDEDLYRTISRGMPGSAMPSWGHLAEEERWGLVHYVKAFAERPLVVEAAADPKAEGQAGTGVVRVPPEPPFTAEVRARALELYADACASCHGKTGKGDGAQDQRDDKARGAPSRRNFTAASWPGCPARPCP